VPCRRVIERGQEANFSNRDKELLVDIVINQLKDVIGNYRTDAVTTLEKAKAWESIAQELARVRQKVPIVHVRQVRGSSTTFIHHYPPLPPLPPLSTHIHHYPPLCKNGTRGHYRMPKIILERF
jgi:hypothetical protein